ncbi:class I SAM-dependent DNA methyltransferase [Caulobacter sp. S45]|uniref:class I SAM-dependent DNA methyltransferase n=1 Tax=Caulobacter sp. S45 TaxID=1641861 RepID=UPI001576B919|nr:class I SAM-dependent DNA methyltransferase [Caulobacter sp. S45]
MIASEFVQKWSDATLRERQGSQEHFLDLCRLLGEPTPAEDDPHGERYCFERGATKVGGGDGWADVWRKGCFGWEYKGRHKNLGSALRQLQAYALDLQNPPYLVVSDMERIVVHTNWTNTVSRRIELTLADLLEPVRLDELRQVFRGSDSLKPGVSPQELTARVAVRFGELSTRLQERGEHPRAVAHFLNQLVFCMFAESARLLPDRLFTRTLKATLQRPAAARAQLRDLFAKMAEPNPEQRYFGPDLIGWFNGGLFDGAEPLHLETADLRTIADTAAEHDWSQIDPSIFGTLFEAALHATRERPALGAHYTDREKILKIVDPVIVRPLTADWDATRAILRAAMDEVKAVDDERRTVMERAGNILRADPAGAKAGEAARRRILTAIARRRDAAHAQAKAALEAFLERLGAFRVLDPACGSGNFLYVALHALKDIELRALVDAERLGVPAPAPRVGLAAVRGIEIEPYAAELARVTLWIGDLQWMRKNGYTAFAEPILSTLNQIENRDALLNPNGTEAEWPPADAIIGNPPFLGGKRLRDGLGDTTVERLFAAYRGRVPAEADFVTYWVEKAWRAIAAERAMRAGLVTTNSVRGGASRRVLDPIADAGAMMEAWADEPWTVKGAAVRVSMLGFGGGFIDRRLEGRLSERINADFTGAMADLTQALRLPENAGVAFQGITKGAPFEIGADLARTWLASPLNVNGRPNSDVLRPITSGGDIVRRGNLGWAIDFTTKSRDAAAQYESPYEYCVREVQPLRQSNRRQLYRDNWWLFSESRPGLRSKLNGQTRFIATPKVSRTRVFVWLSARVIPDNLVIAIGRDDETSFGMLSSKAHELWALRMGAWIGVGNDPTYTPSTTFETFPFPEGLTPDIPAADYADDPRAIAIAEAAAELNRLREAWLNPPDLVRIEPEVVPGYPDRILPRDEAAARVLKTRTLTNLYNARPAWLDMAHRRLDAAVAAAYGWPEKTSAELPDEEVLARLFALNQARAG